MAVAERKKIVGGEWYGRALERKGSGDTIFFNGLLFVRRRSEPGARVSVLATNGMKTCLSPSCRVTSRPTSHLSAAPNVEI